MAVSVSFYLAVSGGIWRNPTVSGKYLGGIWEISGGLWRDLAAYGGIWEISGGIKRHRAVSDRICCIWRYLHHLAVSGGICEQSELSAQSVERIQRAATSNRGSSDMQQRAATCAGKPCVDNAFPVHLSDSFAFRHMLHVLTFGHQGRHRLADLLPAIVAIATSSVK